MKKCLNIQVLKKDTRIKSKDHNYSWNPNKRDGLNKLAGLHISENLINVQGVMHPSCQKIDKYYVKNE